MSENRPDGQEAFNNLTSGRYLDKFEKRSIKLPANLFQVPQPIHHQVSPLAAPRVKLDIAELFGETA